VADIAGKLGMLRIGAWIEKSTIAFVDNGGSADTITDSGDGFLLAGFIAGQSYVITGSDSNNYSFTPSAVAAGVLTVPTGTVTAELAGALVKIVANPPGAVTYGIINFTVNYNGDVIDVSTYETVQADVSSPRDFIGTTTGWTLNAGAYYDTGETAEEDFVGRKRQFFIFTKYVAIPAGGDEAYYYSGSGYITGINPSSEVGTVVSYPITIQGDGVLSGLTEKASSW